MKYLGRVKMVLRNHVGSINFADPVNIRKAPKEQMNHVGTNVIPISNKYKIQIEPIKFEWDKFLLSLEKDFPEILHEVLSYNNHQQQLLNSNENRSTSNENRNQYNAGIDRGTSTHTTSSPSTIHPSQAHVFQQMSHSMPNTTNA